MTTISPQFITEGGEPPVYYPVDSPEYIEIGANTFLHLYNASTTDDDAITILPYLTPGPIHIYPPGHHDIYNCYVVVLPLGEELILGPFELAIFGPVIELIHSHTADVTMAAITPYIRGIPCSSKITITWSLQEQTTDMIIWPSEQTTSTVLPHSPTVVTEIWLDKTISRDMVAYPSATTATVTWPNKTEVRETWCSL